jgi:hypothetical protein
VLFLRETKKRKAKQKKKESKAKQKKTGFLRGKDGKRSLKGKKKLRRVEYS